MPGTFGSLGALPLGWLLWHLPAGAGMVCAAIFALAAVPLAGAAQRLLRQPDPGCIVVDEAAGMLLALTALPPGWLTLALGFAFFRGFDIFKPWPIGWLDRTVKGGLGIVADDLAAGLAANLLVRMVLTALPPP
jgi:phosphatidylglycerophosphatase A